VSRRQCRLLSHWNPGETVEIAFPEPGSFLVFCGIHPKMELTVDVDP
jgi:cytochrome c peroxidase